MSTFGNLEPFDGGDFAAYKERLEAFLFANNIGIVESDATAAVKQVADKKKCRYNFVDWKENLRYTERFMFTGDTCWKVVRRFVQFTDELLQTESFGSR